LHTWSCKAARWNHIAHQARVNREPGQQGARSILGTYVVNLGASCVTLLSTRRTLAFGQAKQARTTRARTRLSCDSMPRWKRCQDLRYETRSIDSQEQVSVFKRSSLGWQAIKSGLASDPMCPCMRSSVACQAIQCARACDQAWLVKRSNVAMQAIKPGLASHPIRARTRSSLPLQAIKPGSSSHPIWPCTRSHVTMQAIKPRLSGLLSQPCTRSSLGCRAIRSGAVRDQVQVVGRSSLGISAIKPGFVRPSSLGVIICSSAP
jgi:hypothetical protein